VTARQRKGLRILAVVAALNVLAGLAYTLPRTVQGRRLSEQKALLEGEVARQEQVLAARRVHADTLRLNAEDSRRFHDSVVKPRAASLVPVLQQIEGMAREGGLKPGAASYRVEAVTGLGVDRFVITMPVNGTYAQLVNFIERLERSAYFLTLDQVAVRGEAEDAEGEGGGEAHLSMVLSSYFRSS
jgi:hypothetical protein